MHKLLFLLLLGAVTIGFAQSGSSSWTRSQASVVKENGFHSLSVVNVPTASTMKKKDFEFEISHRFIPPVTEGTDALWGLDGPVNMRLALTFAITDELQIAVGRSNADDNADIQLKYQFLRNYQIGVPIFAALNAGVAYNSQPVGAVASNDRKYQYYGQLIFNTVINKKLGIGIVPSYLYNSHIYCPDVQESWVLPVYVQYYINPVLSYQVEWAPTLSGWRQHYDSYTLGIELETGGHFFKIFFTNNNVINTAQFLAGADLDPDKTDWRLGFSITRLLDLL